MYCRGSRVSPSNVAVSSCRPGVSRRGPDPPSSGRRVGDVRPVPGADADLVVPVRNLLEHVADEADLERLAEVELGHRLAAQVGHPDGPEQGLARRVAVPRGVLGDDAGAGHVGPGRQVPVDHLVHVAVQRQPALLQQHRPGTQGLDRGHVVADEQDRPAAAADLAHLPEALLLELGVADRQHLVHDQDFRLQVRRHRERQPDVHPAGVPLDRRVEELADLGELDDLVELPPHLPAGHAEDRAVEEDVLPAGQLRVEAGARLRAGCRPDRAAEPRPRSAR